LTFSPVKIDFYENKSGDWTFVHQGMKIGTGSRIVSSTVEGPLYLNRNTQLGPDVTAGKYLGMNENCFIARAAIGAFCSIGARTAINPFNHPINWLSIHEFQYHARSFDWISDYREMKRLDRTPDMFQRVSIGNDVWMGHNVNVLSGVTVGDGAVIGAGSVVTKPVPPYAVVAGVPAKLVRYRFDERTIERLLAVRWWEFDLPELSGLNFRDVVDCLHILEEMRARRSASMASCQAR
jgi:acetyltransferase-like isoleucine patch superfamily enzyme